MADELDPVELIAWAALAYVAYLIYPSLVSASPRRRAAIAPSGAQGTYGTGTPSTYGSPLAMIAAIGTGNTQGGGSAPIGIGNTAATAPIGTGNIAQATAPTGTGNASAPIGTGNQGGTPSGGTAGTPSGGTPSGGTAPGDQSGKFSGPFGVSANGVAFIQNEEGLSLNRFLDAGHWAIGYGHDYPAGQIPPASITQGEADALLQQDLDAVVNSLNAKIGVPLTQNQFDALVSIGFNVGTAGIPSLLNAVNAGNDTLAASLFGQYDHSQGKVLPALAARRAREAQLYSS